MKLVFDGTRGNIEVRSRRHFRHTSLTVSYHGRRVIVDRGADWLGAARNEQAQAIVLTHAHDDHAAGLARGVSCPVFATRDTWRLIDRYPIADRGVVRPRRPFAIAGITFEAFPVEHSLRAPAVGYRIAAGRVAVFYCPDLVFIRDRDAALAQVALYIGDGTTITRPLVRRRGRRLIGHTMVPAQLAWCRHAGVPRAIITHCGTEIVAADQRKLNARINELGRRYGLRVEVAEDGMRAIVRGR